MGRCYMGEHQDHRPHAHPSVKCAQPRKHAADSPRIRAWLQHHRDDVRFIIGPARALKSLKPYHSNQPRQIGALVHAAVLALVILLPRWGVALLVMGGREMSAARRVKDWEPAGGFGNWPEGVAGGLSAVFSTGLRGAEGRRVWRTAFGHTSPGRSAPVRWAWRTGRFPTLAS